jgi:biopolymer transport protein ExbD
MSFGSFNDGGQQPMADINTTPLVDVMLVLLVIFIITAPLFNQAVPVDLPKVDASKLEEKPKVIQVELDSNGELMLNGERTEFSAFEAACRALATKDSHPELHLRADRSVRYEKVADILAAAQRAGVDKIAFVTDPKP